MVAVRDILLFVALALAIVNLQVTQNLMGFQSASKEPGHLERGYHVKRSVQLVAQPDLNDQLTSANGMIQALAQVIMKLQSTLEQRVRFEGNSGITEARGYSAGTQPYHSSTHNTLNIHDHADTIDTMGMGEFSAILNGVEFTTRHNDYLLAQPVVAGGTSNYHKTTPIPHPLVPPSVLAKATVAEQVVEMREYFRAFKTQNISIRDYRPYFKAQLCYLEGTWIKNTVNIDEPFRSDRHAIDAATWKDLNEKYRFLMNNGQKNNLENLAWLPTTVRDLQDREQFDVTYNRAVSAFISDKSNPRPVKGGWPKSDVPTDQIFVTLSSRVEGIFLTIRNNFGSAGSLTVNVSCTNKTEGCFYTPKPVCSSGSTCTWSTTNLNGTNKLSWAAGALASVTYGPLTACFAVDVAFSDVVGATVLFLSQTATAPTKNFTVTQPLQISGCIFPAEPVLANWEYRILCSPIQGDLPTNRFRVFEDNAAFLRDKKNVTTMKDSRRCLFELNPSNRSVFSDSGTTFELIDEIMQTIPGKDNYGVNLTDTSFGSTTLHYKNNSVLNVGYYSRFFALSENDAMGRSQRRRGFNDPTLWAAMTTQDKVAGLSVYDDVDQVTRHQKWSYAIPLEVVYMTPLSSWNPYNLFTWPKNATSDQMASITAGGRNGGLNASNAYNKTSHKHFFHTPLEFFSGLAGEADPADTSSGAAKGVLDDNGVVRVVMASGHYIIMPDIPGVGPVRQRWPIFPLHETKYLAYKEIKAFEAMKPTLKRGGAPVIDESVTLWTSYSHGTDSLHQHELQLGPFEIAQLDAGQMIILDSDLAAGHTHQIKVSRKKVGDNFVYTMELCDASMPCFDGHDRVCTEPDCKSFAPPVPVPTPVVAPTTAPSIPVNGPSAPSSAPSTAPSTAPSSSPVAQPTTTPMTVPVAQPTTTPMTAPVAHPTTTPMTGPVAQPTTTPVTVPVVQPATVPTTVPTTTPVPTQAPTNAPVKPDRSDNPIGVGGGIGVAVAILGALLLGLTVGYLAFVNFPTALEMI